MARRIKQYRLRMTEEEFARLEYLSQRLNMPKSKVIRHAIKAADMSLLCLEEHKERLRQAYNGGFTHAAVYSDTDSIKSTKPNIEPLGGAKN